MSFYLVFCGVLVSYVVMSTQYTPYQLSSFFLYSKSLTSNGSHIVVLTYKSTRFHSLKTVIYKGFPSHVAK